MQRSGFIAVTLITTTILGFLFTGCSVDGGDIPQPTAVSTEELTAAPSPDITESPTESPTDEPTPVITSAPVVHRVQIGATIQGSYFTQYDIVYNVVVMVDSSVCSTATVTVQGPHGTTTLLNTPDGSGTYQYSTSSATNYQAGSTYTVSVDIDGAIYSDSIVACGGITITATQATWTADGTQDKISVVDASSNYHSLGPDLTPPVSISSLLTTGINMVTVTCNNSRNGQFSNGALASSLLSTQFFEMQQVSK
jgi:hypothetical protein